MYYGFAIVLKRSELGAREAPIGILTLSLEWNPQLSGYIGFEIDPAYWGRGYATEAAAAVLKMSFEELGVARVTADCFAANHASIRVMEKIGMRRSMSWMDSISLRITYGELRSVVRHQVRRDEWKLRLRQETRIN